MDSRQFGLFGFEGVSKGACVNSVLEITQAPHYGVYSRFAQEKRLALGKSLFFSTCCQ
jgi:hypothetical protein